MTDPSTTIINGAVGLITGAIYGLLWYSRKRQKNGEAFDQYKFAGTLLIAAGVGVAYGLSGQEITPESIGTVLVANAGLLALAEPILKSLANSAGIFPRYAG